MNKLLRAILDEAQSAHLRSLVIGGAAVNAFGYPRITYDLDLLVRRNDVERWAGIMEKLSYKRVPEQVTFAQFMPPLGGMPPVDLILVNDSTFEKMFISAVAKEMNGLAINVPAPLHLVSLKLHALRHGKLERRAKDLDDTIQLILLNRIDVRGTAFREACERFGTPELYEEIRKIIERSI
jgi:hypothetical protein